VIITLDGNGEFLINPLIQKWPELDAATYYRIFPKKKHLVLRFYDKNRRWIRINEQLRTGNT
jgi:hypothetical protein